MQYTVTSEDGQWKRTYTVSMGMRTLDAITNFSFENVQMVTEGCNRPYDAWVEPFDDGYVMDCWATGNGGFDISMGLEDDENHVTKDQFPSVSVDNGRTGKAVRLTTCDTGPFGHLMNMPIAAGNLFLGKFDLSEALGETLKAHRIRCQMTQEFEAEALGVIRQTVSKWENGSADPSTTNLLALAKLYGVEAEDLLRGIDRSEE